jgi:hypothetical protein
MASLVSFSLNLIKNQGSVPKVANAGQAEGAG